VNSTACLVLSFLQQSLLGEVDPNRFPPPEFETPHELPTTSTPSARALPLEYVDVALLVIALSVAAWLVIRKRSRRGLVWLGVISLVYFGFYREGCVCSIGATQNVTLAIFDSSYRVPMAAVLFFALPLAFTLFFGRGFCASVCPLGAIQDVVLLRPLRVPPWLDQALRVGAYAYLGLAVLLAATKTAFIICRYDPFVGFFRLSGSLEMLIFGGCLLAIGVVVGRPYCRYLCPYGVLLGFAGRLSRLRVTITPDHCVQCRLCEESCPFGSIDTATPPRSAADRSAARKRVGRLILITPIIVVASGWLGSELGGPLSRLHPTVKLAEAVRDEQLGVRKIDAAAAEAPAAAPVEAADDDEPSDEVRALTKRKESADAVFAAAIDVRSSFTSGGWWFGMWMGLVVAIKLIWLSRLPYRHDYEADRGTCFACARCYDFCPQEHTRLETLARAQPRPAGGAK